MKITVIRFYSTLVRLKDGLNFDNACLKLFLFHIGAIKRQVRQSDPYYLQYSFYSTLVRLKVKAQGRSLNTEILCFYSTLVRLKVREFCLPPGRGQRRFYSTLVRLKDALMPMCHSSLSRFLFHIGAIKSSIQGHKVKIIKSFLFHIGAIKSTCYRSKCRGVYGFYSTLVRLKDLIQ